MDEMKAVVCHQGQLTVAAVPRPVPGPGQILLRTRRTGICGSDLHARVHSEQLADTVAELGYDSAIRPDQHVVMGHEFTGEVVSYGPKTRRRWPPGTRIAAIPVVRAGGRIHMTGFDAASPGGFAEFVVVQEAFAFPVPEGLDDDKAAFTEPLAVAWHAVRRGGTRRGRPAIVIGCGPIGLAVVLMLKAAGVRTVVASDLSPGRRELARECGADVVVDPRETSPWDAYRQRGPVGSFSEYMNYGIDIITRIRAVPGLPWQRLLRVADQAGASPAGPVVFECVGVPGMIDQVLAAAPLNTRVVVVGVCMESDRFRPALAIHKEIELRFVFGYDPGEFSDTLDMIAAGKVDPSALHTGTVGLDGVPGAFDDLGDPERHAKILVDPGVTH